MFGNEDDEARPVIVMQNKQKIEESESDEGLLQHDDDEVVVQIKDRAPADRDSDSDDSDSDQSDGGN